MLHVHIAALLVEISFLSGNIPILDPLSTIEGLSDRAILAKSLVLAEGREDTEGHFGGARYQIQCLPRVIEAWLRVQLVILLVELGVEEFAGLLAVSAWDHQHATNGRYGKQKLFRHHNLIIIINMKIFFYFYIQKYLMESFRGNYQ